MKFNFQKFPEQPDIVLRTYIRGIIDDINEVERLRINNANPDNCMEVLAKENYLGARFLNLANLISFDIDLFRECILTAYTLDPSPDNYQLIVHLARKLYGPQAIDHKFPFYYQQKTSNYVNSMHGVTGEFFLNCPTYNEDIAPNGIIDSGQLLERTKVDLSIVIGAMRVKKMTWLMNWSSLDNNLKQLLQPAAKVEQLSKTLTSFNQRLEFVKVDFKKYYHLRPGIYPSIEQGYEMYDSHDAASRSTSVLSSPSDQSFVYDGSRRSEKATKRKTKTKKSTRKPSITTKKNENLLQAQVKDEIQRPVKRVSTYPHIVNLTDSNNRYDVKSLETNAKYGVNAELFKQDLMKLRYDFLRQKLIPNLPSLKIVYDSKRETTEITEIYSSFNDKTGQSQANESPIELLNQKNWVSIEADMENTKECTDEMTDKPDINNVVNDIEVETEIDEANDAEVAGFCQPDIDVKPPTNIKPMYILRKINTYYYDKVVKKMIPTTLFVSSRRPQVEICEQSFSLRMQTAMEIAGRQPDESKVITPTVLIQPEPSQVETILSKTPIPETVPTASSQPLQPTVLPNSPIQVAIRSISCEPVLLPKSPVPLSELPSEDMQTILSESVAKSSTDDDTRPTVLAEDNLQVTVQSNAPVDETETTVSNESVILPESSVVQTLISTSPIRQTIQSTSTEDTDELTSQANLPLCETTHLSDSTILPTSPGSEILRFDISSEWDTPPNSPVFPEIIENEIEIESESSSPDCLLRPIHIIFDERETVCTAHRQNAVTQTSPIGMVADQHCAEDDDSLRTGNLLGFCFYCVFG